MPLTVGSRIAHYDVTALIGEGGMGQVYQATDTKLNRQVALKILPEAFASDPDRLARFQREAQVLASLNHPNIAQIHGIEEDEGTRALVLELVEGPTLADRISKGPIPLDEALPIAKQIAEALEAAHEAGVIHRDLKPANIKVRDDGTVKVLDFGLAKALETGADGDPAESPTLTAMASQAGVIMGTAAYMSPEQARGESVDKRADIWAFGVVFYEMLTGRRPFEGRTVSDTLASVLARDPDLDSLPTNIPRAVHRLFRRCFEKEPKRRLRDIVEGLFQLEDGLQLPVPRSTHWGRLTSHITTLLTYRGVNAVMESWFSTVKHQLGDHFESCGDDTRRSARSVRPSLNDGFSSLTKPSTKLDHAQGLRCLARGDLCLKRKNGSSPHWGRSLPVQRQLDNAAPLPGRPLQPVIRFLYAYLRNHTNLHRSSQEPRSRGHLRASRDQCRPLSGNIECGRHLDAQTSFVGELQMTLDGKNIQNQLLATIHG